MKRAISYIRFSSGPQAKGDSLTRQTSLAAQWCEANGYYLDTSFTYQDLGVSGFTGANLKEGGAFKAITDAIDDGTIEAGTALIVESLDRISRMKPNDAAQLFLSVVNRGITVVTLLPAPEVFTRETTDIGRLFTSIIVMQRAWEESAIKSRRKIESNKRKAEAAREGKQVGKLCPRWLRPSSDGNGYELIPDKAATVRKIFQLCLAGEGTGAIAKHLNDNGYSVLQHGKQWSSGQVKHVLSNKRTIGYKFIMKQVDGKLVQDGEAIADYFPKVVTEAEYYECQQLLTQKRVGKAGPRGKKVSTLFTNIVFHGEQPFRYRPTNTGNFLIGPPEAKIGGSKTNVSVPYEIFEKAIISFMTELDPDELIHGSRPKENQIQLQSVAGQLADVTDNIESVKERLMQKFNTNLADILDQLEAKQIELQDLKERLEIETRNSKKDTIEDLQDLIRRMEWEDSYQLRTKVKRRLRQLIERITVQVFQPATLTRFVIIDVKLNKIDEPKQIIIRLTNRYKQKGTEWEAVDLTSELHSVSGDNKDESFQLTEKLRAHYISLAR